MPKSKPKTERAQTTSERRQLIIATAVECFTEKGFHQTSVRDIAKRANISLGNLYNHFENKSALIRDISEYEADGLDDAKALLATIEDPKEALDKFVSLYIEGCLQREAIVLTAEIVSEGLRDPDIVPGFVENRAEANRLASDLIRRVQDEAQAEVVMPAEDCAEYIFDLIEGLAVRFALERKPVTAADKQTLYAAIWRLVGI